MDNQFLTRNKRAITILFIIFLIIGVGLLVAYQILLNSADCMETCGPNYPQNYNDQCCINFYHNTCKSRSDCMSPILLIIGLVVTGIACLCCCVFCCKNILIPAANNIKTYNPPAYVTQRKKKLVKVEAYAWVDDN